MNKTLQSIADRYNQQSDDSLLWKDIQTVLSCTESQAKKYALSHCNSLSFYMGLFADDYIHTDYAEYFKIGYDAKLIDKNGWIGDKKKLCSLLGYDNFPQKMIRKWDDILSMTGIEPEKKYQVRIKTSWNKLKFKWNNHFMICDITPENGLLTIYDTWDEEYNGVSIFKKVNEKNFDAMMEV